MVEHATTLHGTAPDRLEAPVLVLTGSTREGSLTRRLAGPLSDLPYFDQDLETVPPTAVVDLRRQVAAADVVALVTPEYNGAVPGLLANAIDWLSRPRGSLAGIRVLTVSASPGAGGGARALVALQTVLASTGADVVGSLSVPRAGDLLEDPTALSAALDALVSGLEARRAA
jgi:chromate reductase, NAD(P)H dehydrogenase (quinone)